MIHRQSADSVSVQLFSQTWLLVSPAILETLTVISTESSESSTAESDGNVSSQVINQNILLKMS